MATFVLNPYLGDVNPGTSDGLKLYNKDYKDICNPHLFFYCLDC